MAQNNVLQYVGARYVPVFYNNPNGTWEWLSGVQYEALTIVKYGTQTYTSKQLVPATVGSPNSAPEYWALTGDYNGAIVDIQEQISVLKKRNIVLVGDSWTVGYSDGTSARQGLEYWFKALYPYYNIISSTQNGGGFSSGFLNAIQTVYMPEGISEEDIEIVAFIGGTNDFFTTDVSSIDSGMQECLSYTKTRFPNAVIEVGCFTSPLYALGYKNENMEYGVSEYYRKCQNYGAIYIEGLERLVCDHSLYGPDSSTGEMNVHLTQAGYQFYSPYVIDAILSGSASYRFEFSSSNIQYGEGLTVDQGVVLHYIVEPEGVSIRFSSSAGSSWKFHRYLPVNEGDLLADITDISNVAVVTPTEQGETSNKGIVFSESALTGVCWFDFIQQTNLSGAVRFRLFYSNFVAGDNSLSGPGVSISKG